MAGVESRASKKNSIFEEEAVFRVRAIGGNQVLNIPTSRLGAKSTLSILKNLSEDFRDLRVKVLISTLESENIDPESDSNTELKTRFGWEDVSVKDAASLFSAITNTSGIFIYDVDGNKLDEPVILPAAQVVNRYQEIVDVNWRELLEDSKSCVDNSLDSQSFLDIWEAIHSQGKSETIEKGIRNTGLSARGYAVVVYLTRGMQAQDISRILGISYSRVRHFVTEIGEKLSVEDKQIDSKYKIVDYALENNLISPVHLKEMPEDLLSDGVERLTVRQRQVLEEGLSGSTRSETAVQLGIKESTVRSHRNELFKELGTNNIVTSGVILYLSEIE